MKYKEGDRVRINSLDWYNENKDEDGIVELSTHIFTPGMSQFCGKVMTIEDVFEDIDDNAVYYMEEIDYDWTDEMIEGLAEEETKPKFKVGDKVKDKNNRVWFIVRVSETFFDISSVPNAQGYFVPIDDQDDYELVPQYFSNEIEMNNVKRNACQKCVFAVRDDSPHCGLRGFTTSFNVECCESENDKAPNGFELQEDGYFSWVKKKKDMTYPKTYEECCCILHEYPTQPSITGYKHELLHTFRKLLICLDAYWMIAGEEMGLGKPWEPDYTEESWEQGSPIKYVIYNNGTCIVKERKSSPNHILAFPTEEMRDAFYEAFKELIEECKELL